MKQKFYITTPIYYVNDKPHLGHAYTTIAADVLTRFNKIKNKDIFFLVGTDEHGLKIQKKAEEKGKNPQEFVDEVAKEFKMLWDKLNIKYDNFIRTTDKKHKEAVIKVLQTLYDKGVIYKGNYEGLYCVGCEQFKSENELVDGKCPDHDKKPELLKEECYLLKLKEIQQTLIEKIKSGEFQIAPDRYKKEILSFLESQELKDISISRKNVKWGISLPFDKEQTVYVWFDAFLNYLTGLGWDGDEKKIPEIWPPAVQLIGKDILRVHATIWPAMLIHLGIPLPKLLFTHGHILSGGKKMSKTLGNTISIDEMLEKFGVDGTRYLLLSAGTFGEDVDITMERMVEKYNADLANELGNLLSRVIKLAEGLEIDNYKLDIEIYSGEYAEKIIGLKFEHVLELIWNTVRADNKYIDAKKPWELKKTDQLKFKEVIKKLFIDLYQLHLELIPFIPDTAEKIKKSLETKKSEILFPRI